MDDKRTTNVPDIEVGDRFIWVDRVVTVEQVVDAPSGSRPGRHLHVREEAGAVHRLHYFDNERVQRA